MEEEVEEVLEVTEGDLEEIGEVEVTMGAGVEVITVLIEEAMAEEAEDLQLRVTREEVLVVVEDRRAVVVVVVVVEGEEDKRSVFEGKHTRKF